MTVIFSPNSNLPDGTLINGSAHFVRSTKPATRVDGSALAVNDKWYDTTNRLDWYWNGTYWLSSRMYFQATFQNNVASSFYWNYRYWYFVDNFNMFLHSFWVESRISASLPTGWSHNTLIYPASNAATPIWSNTNSITFVDRFNNFQFAYAKVATNLYMPTNASTNADPYRAAQIGLTASSGGLLIQPSITFEYSLVA